MCHSLIMTKTPEEIDAIINEILELEKYRDNMYHMGLCVEAAELDSRIVNMIFDELQDDMYFERYLQLSQEEALALNYTSCEGL